MSAALPVPYQSVLMTGKGLVSSQWQAFFRSVLSALSPSGYDTASPLTGTTVTTSSPAPGLLLTPAGTLATLTIKLPPSPIDGQEYWIATSQSVTSTTWKDGGGTSANVIGGPSPLTTSGARFVYVASGSKWYSI